MKRLFQMLVVVGGKALQGANPQKHKSGVTTPTELVVPEVVLPRRLPQSVVELGKGVRNTMSIPTQRKK